MARIIESPGVQISEIDLSLNASLPVGTNILINGFTDQGPSQELLNVTSITEYEQIYGVPTNAAERYSYHTMKSLLSTPAKVVFNRLPYGRSGGTGFNDRYTALLYPAYTASSNGSPLSGEGDFFIGTPTQISITEGTYRSWKEGTIIWNSTTSTWDETGGSGASAVGDAAFVVINKIQTSVNQDFEGYYIALSDNRKSSTTSTSKDFEFNTVSSVLTSKSHVDGITSVNNWEELQDSRLNFQLTGNISDQPDSISEAVETIPTWDFGTSQYDDGLIFGLYKFRRSGYAQDQNALQFIQYENYVGSLGADRKYTDPTGFQETSFFIENIMNESSAFLDIMVNPNLSQGDWIDSEGNPNRTIRIVDENVVSLLDDFQSVPEITVSSTTGVLSGDYTRSGIVGDRYSYIDGNNTVLYNTDRWHIHSSLSGGNLFENITTDIQPPRSGWVGITSPATDYADISYDSIALHGDTVQSDAAFTLGLYQEKVEEVKSIGDIPEKLKLGLRLAEDYEVIPLDIVLDAGLSTIHTTMSLSGGEEFYDITAMDTSSLNDTVTGSASVVATAWLTIFNQFDIFCRDTRKDCMFIADVYRNILVDGKDYKTLTDKTKNFSQHVYTPLKNLTAKCNSSYSATYAQWIKVYDGQTSDYAWIPYSGFQGAIMSRLDSVLYPWSAPAGLENGLVVGGLDLALPTTQKQRDLLYRNNLNAVVFFPSDGMVCWGQKTLQKKPSALDRVNVRRLFLTLEKSTRSLMKYFVFQPNTTFTRTRVVNVLTPIFDVAKNNEGVYDYLIVCDERNNTPAVIDNNELQVDIYLKPVRTAEFILVNFYATRTDQNFNELI